MIQAVIFDMDGLLIDSEPLWKKAEIELFSNVGVPLTLEMTNQTMGLRTDEVVEHWHKRYPWESPTQKEVCEKLDEMVLELVKKEGIAKDGVHEAISVCESANLPMAIASSSSLSMINAVMDKLNIRDKIKVVHSAHDEDFGKPHPAVYISTAQELGVKPVNCLAFEDSANGVISAKAAKMKCIAIPEPDMIHDKRFLIADIVIGSLNELTTRMLEDL